MKFDMDKSRNICIVTFIMIVFTLAVLLAASFGMQTVINHSVNGLKHSITNNKTVIDFNDPNIVTLVHDNDTD